MKIPSLNKVFLIEGNVTHIAQMTKVPVEVVKEIDEFDREHTFQLTKYVKYLYDYAAKSRIELQKYGLGKGELDYFNFIPKDKTDQSTDLFLLSKAFKISKEFKKWFDTINFKTIDRNEVNEIFKKAEEIIVNAKIKHNPGDVSRQKKEAIITFPDGYFWHLLNSADDKKKEGEMMHNCIGTATCPVGDTYSLKDENGKSHVDAQMTDKNVMKQVFGPANKDIKPEEIDKLVALIKKLNVKEAYGNDSIDDDNDVENTISAFTKAGIHIY